MIHFWYRDEQSREPAAITPPLGCAAYASKRSSSSCSPLPLPASTRGLRSTAAADTGRESCWTRPDASLFADFCISFWYWKFAHCFAFWTSVFMPDDFCFGNMKQFVAINQLWLEHSSNNPFRYKNILQATPGYGLICSYTSRQGDLFTSYLLWLIYLWQCMNAGSKTIRAKNATSECTFVAHE